MISLTSRQAEALRWIHGFQIANEGGSPSYDEIGKGLGLRGRSSVVRIILALQERGWIHRRASRARSIEVLCPLPVPLAPDGAPLFLVNGVLPS